jgi:hypothetical protein
MTNETQTTQHSPSPWHVGPPPPNMPMNAVFDANQIMVASTGGYSTNGRDADGLRDLQEANARLIAAAPSLLETLRAIAAEPQATTRIGSMARNAIERAPGEQRVIPNEDGSL